MWGIYKTALKLQAGDEYASLRGEWTNEWMNKQTNEQPNPVVPWCPEEQLSQNGHILGVEAAAGASMG